MPRQSLLAGGARPLECASAACARSAPIRRLRAALKCLRLRSANARTMRAAEANRFAMEIALLKHTPEGSACAARPAKSPMSLRLKSGASKSQAGWLIRRMSNSFDDPQHFKNFEPSHRAVLAILERGLRARRHAQTHRRACTRSHDQVGRDRRLGRHHRRRRVWVASTAPLPCIHIDPKNQPSLAASVILPWRTVRRHGRRWR